MKTSRNADNASSSVAQASPAVAAPVALEAACLCGSGLAYSACCKRYHSGSEVPALPEALMRSRYTACALGLVDYLMASTHRDNPVALPKRPLEWRKNVADYCKQHEFLGLEILSASTPSATWNPETATEGSVHFRATLQQKGQSSVVWLEERSQFKKAGKRWLYFKGDVTLKPAEL
jgi:SEC-C motif domain protein